jgi:hypothetical protein
VSAQARVSATGKPPYGPLNPQPPHLFMEEQEASVRAQGEQNGWGALVGICVLGKSVVYTFKNGTTVTGSLPPNARTE